MRNMPVNTNLRSSTCGIRYTPSRDVKAATAQFVGVGYNRWYSISDAVRLVFRDAGHILGSASVVLEINEGKSEPLKAGFQRRYRAAGPANP